MYTLIFYKSKALLRDQKKIKKNIKNLENIQCMLGKLILNPFDKHLPVKKLKNSAEATFRLRCNTWRVLYDVDTTNKKIIIYRMKQRKEGYR